MKPGFGCAIGLVNIEGKSHADFEHFLFDNYKVHTTQILWENRGQALLLQSRWEY